MLTLATGVVALSITFMRDLLPAPSSGARALVVASWGVFIVSILFGILTLMSAAGNQATTAAPDPYAKNLRLLGAIQLSAFVLGLVLSAIAVSVAMAG